jgi:hypothetical protein
VVVVQIGSLAGGGVGQTVSGAHGPVTAVPPLHEVVVWLWQTMPRPQSLALPQVCALACPVMASTAIKAVIHKLGFVGVMVVSFDRVDASMVQTSMLRASLPDARSGLISCSSRPW